MLYPHIEGLTNCTCLINVRESQCHQPPNLAGDVCARAVSIKIGNVKFDEVSGKKADDNSFECSYFPN